MSKPRLGFGVNCPILIQGVSYLSPNWDLESAEHYGDWRDYIDYQVAKRWDSFSDDQKRVIARGALCLWSSLGPRYPGAVSAKVRRYVLHRPVCKPSNLN